MSQQKVTSAPRIEFQVHIRRGRRGRHTLQDGPPPKPRPVREAIPRVTKLLALAHRWRDLINRGELRDQAEIAELMGITRARVTQIMNLAFLAPEIQELILDPDSPPTGALATEMMLRRLCAEPDWNRQLSQLQ